MFGLSDPAFDLPNVGLGSGDALSLRLHAAAVGVAQGISKNVPGCGTDFGKGRKMKVVIEGRDLTARYWKIDSKGTESGKEYISDPLLSISGVEVHSVEHVRIDKVWFVKAPEREQKRLEADWNSRRGSKML